MALAVLTLGSCTKKDDLVVLEDKAVKAAQFIDLPNGTVVLDKENPDAIAPILFAWTKAEYGYQAAVTYSVEIAAENSSEYVELLQTPKQFATITNKNLNNALIKMKLKADIDALIKMRLKSSISTSYPDTLSTVVTVNVRPYSTEVIYPSIGLPGSYQGWAPENPMTRLYSIENNGKYSGWIDLQTADGSALEFKFVNGFDWGSENLGGPAPTVEASGVVRGTISGGDNIKGVPQSYYKMEVNWTAATYVFTPISTWGLIGSATPGGWDSSTPMTYDRATNLWTVDVTMTDGEFKFRANNGWDINFGKSPEEGVLLAGGDNMPITAGNYTVTMNLGGAIPTYTMTKK